MVSGDVEAIQPPQVHLRTQNSGLCGCPWCYVTLETCCFDVLHLHYKS